MTFYLPYVFSRNTFRSCRSDDVVALQLKTAELNKGDITEEAEGYHQAEGCTCNHVGGGGYNRP